MEPTISANRFALKVAGLEPTLALELLRLNNAVLSTTTSKSSLSSLMVGSKLRELTVDIFIDSLGGTGLTDLGGEEELPTSATIDIFDVVFLGGAGGSGIQLSSSLSEDMISANADITSVALGLGAAS